MTRIKMAYYAAQVRWWAALRNGLARLSDLCNDKCLRSFEAYCRTNPPPMTRIIVCGGRDYADRARV